MNLAVLLTVFAIIFVAELPDKTALAGLVLGARYPSRYVFTGAASAFAVHVVLAIAAGSALALLPHRLVEAIVAAMFLVGAVLLLRGRHEEAVEDVEIPEGKRPTFARVGTTAFTVILVAEFGDLTQIVTANLAAKYHDPLSVGIGAGLGLWAVAGLAIVGGRGLLKLVPMKLIVRVAAAVMAVMAVFSIVQAIRG